MHKLLKTISYTRVVIDGPALKLERKRLRLTLRDLAEKLKCSQVNISYIENERNFPREARVKKIIQVMDKFRKDYDLRHQGDFDAG